MEISKRAILQRIDNVEDDHKRETRRIEAKEEEVRETNHQFSKRLDDKADRLRFIVSKYDPEAIPPLSHGYNMISHTQDEVNYIVCNELETLENQREEADERYRKEVERLEGELFKKNREDGAE
ncbi:hypothetical protein ACRW9N_08300 [Listeria aquatica]|uniref:hypothetical protein n=1 Tax=Listeria aquatica TaxID=1494960 RepID=UPI003EF453A4